MIHVVDSWGDHPPPPGAADDDDLFAATGVDAAIVVGDRSGRARAEAMGVPVVDHIGTRPGPAGLVRRRIRHRLPSGVEIRPLSIWAAGMIGRPLSAPTSPARTRLRPRSDLRPFVLPVASNPREMDAFRLVLAAALIEAAGGRCLIGLPTGAGAMPRARRLLASSDRLIPVEALACPAPAYIDSADLLLDVGVTPGGPIDDACRSAGAPLVDARRAFTPMSIAIAVRAGLRAEVRP